MLLLTTSGSLRGGGALALALVISCSSGSGTGTPSTDGGQGGSGGTATAILLAEAPQPSQVTVRGGDVFFVDGSEEPIKRVPVAGGAVVSLAYQMDVPLEITSDGTNLYWSELRGGTSPGSRCTGNMAVAALLRASVDGKDHRRIALGDACYGMSGPLVVAETLYWVETTASPATYVIRRAPAGGGAASDLYTAPFGTRVPSLSSDGTSLYWVDDSGMNSTRLMRLSLDGSTPVILYPASAGAEIVGPISAHARSVYLVEKVVDFYHVVAVSTAGGASILATVPDPGPFGRVPVASVVADDERVYWADEHAIRSVPVTGGTPLTLVGEVASTELVLSGEQLLFLSADPSGVTRATTIETVPSAGGAVTTVASSEFPMTRFIVAGSRLYWVEGSPYALEGFARIASVPLHGGTASTVLSGVHPGPVIAVDETSIYVGDRWTLKVMPNHGGTLEALLHWNIGFGSLVTNGRELFLLDVGFGQVGRMLVTGGGVSTAQSPEAGPCGPMRLGTDAVYWLEGYDNIDRMALSGGPAQRAVSGLKFATELTVDATNLYVYENDTGAIIAIPLNGGAARQLASRHWGIEVHLASDGQFLYIADPAGIARVPVAGGGEKALIAFPPGANPNSFALDAESVYWTDALLGIVAKVTPR